MPILYPSSNRFKYARSASDFRARRYAIQNPPPPPFDPSLLFAAMEQGAWYDPSDLSTLFQDAAGTTPVTAVEQPVGLMLDKSRGLVLGAQAITNGSFANGSTGWTFGANVTISGGVATFSTLDVLSQASGVIISNGKWYRITFDQTAATSAGASTIIRFGQNTSNDFFAATGPGSRTAYIYTTAATDQIIRFRYNGTGTLAITNISVRELPGNHAFQTTATSRPVLKQDAGGQYYLRCDGIDDWMVTGTITPGTDKAQVFAGVRKLSDAATGVLFELSLNAGSLGGAFYFASPSLPTNSYEAVSRGFGSIAITGVALASFPAPTQNILNMQADISGDTLRLRVNGTQAAQSTADQGIGNYQAYPLYLFRRGGTTLPFNGHFYGGIIRFGPNLPIETIQQTEAWMAAKTGVTL